MENHEMTCHDCHYSQRNESHEPCVNCVAFSNLAPMTEHKATQIARQVQAEKNANRKADEHSENFNLVVVVIFLIAFCWFVFEVVVGGR